MSGFDSLQVNKQI